VSGVWATPREQQAGSASNVGPILPVGRVVKWFALTVLVVLPFVARSLSLQQFAMFMFWGSCAIIGWVYIGYPLSLAALKRLAGRPARRQLIEPPVCVFVAANDEAAVIESKLRNTLALDYPADRLEIVVASDGSVDETNEIVRRFAPRVRLLEFSPRRGKMATINDGVRSITAEIVVFSDANTFLDSGAVRRLVDNFADPNVGAVSGDVVLVGDRAALGQSEDLYYRYERWIQQAESIIGSMIGADGALYAIRRELFTAPPADTILDDMAIPMGVIRAGRRVVFEGGARAYEQGSETAQEEFSRKTRVVAGAMQFMRRQDSDVPISMPQVILSLVSHKALRWLSPVFAMTAFFSSLLLAGVSVGYAIAVGGQTALIAVGLAGCAPALRRIGFVALAHYFCLVQAAAAVGFLRGLTGRQTVLWRRFERLPHEPAGASSGQ
jgi:cellulose synthase/poly-beta-1,6-N-acetylglucosamine synthase-like glycosyltransferase